MFNYGLFYIIQKSPFGHLLKEKVILTCILSSEAVNYAIITKVIQPV